jgi:cyclopropane-fatty-acyl-phospholipid synthase
MSQDPTGAIDVPELEIPDAGALLHRVRKALLTGVLSRLRTGQLAIRTPHGALFEYRAPHPGPSATILLHRWRTVRRLLAKGGIGFAEAYMDGDWTSPDLTAFLEFAAANAVSLDREISGSRWLRPMLRLGHVRKANTRRGSRRNIAAHYDLGNAFYERWLDRGMTYSSAIFTDPAQTLEQAQAAKLDRVVSGLALTGGERVLEIGCGWGSFAEHALRAGAGHVTGLTLSSEQLAYARDRLARAGLADRADLRLQDYRDIDGRFDRIVSIEMLEAVGERYWSTYFNMLRDRLAEGGSAVVQVITMAADRFDGYSRNVDFIQRYIFPGGMLPTDRMVRDQIARVGLTLTAVETFGHSYAQTLAEWRRRFLQAWPAIEALGFDLRFKRMWEYYLCYCEAGFRDGVIDVGLYRFGKPAAATA